MKYKLKEWNIKADIVILGGSSGTEYQVSQL